MSEQRLVVVGKGEVADALSRMAELLGWGTTVVAALESLAAALPGAQAVVVTSHDDEVDAAAIGAALRSGADYVGAMGSRARQARRRGWLLENGFTKSDLDRVHGPAGLDIGANSPAEIALAIMAELVAVARDVPAPGSLKEGSGPIHPDLPPGATYTPEG